MHGHKSSHLPIRYFLALLWAHPILHISTIRVNIIAIKMEALYRTQSHFLWDFLNTINEVLGENDDKEFPFHKSS